MFIPVTGNIEAAIPRISGNISVVSSCIEDAEGGTILTKSLDSFLPDDSSSSYQKTFEETQTETACPSLTEWTSREENRFQTLAIEEALGEISNRNRLELHYLMTERRKLKNPRLRTEIIRDFQRDQAYHSLKKSLINYIKFVGA